ncbi:hypothetical protein EIN_019000 [Entamoeba invadens IP1]|uniref:hypothetical protein n=1 Tax=Entamoeba invadens IP1 TaxID=370355 RepID=UPI0002C3EEBF|nr:hypothetical protein EIN_019000 [Entamoeba invadens IP1]ELP90531.1 hypothetical protein EIN_019000 [Entamoeba invadens IP1]|eukprot:XP_004257302.1 hypothetical protein EIN_019000 [Entamoeba invadens IP1]
MNKGGLRGGPVSHSTTVTMGQKRSSGSFAKEKDDKKISHSVGQLPTAVCTDSPMRCENPGFSNIKNKTLFEDDSSETDTPVVEQKHKVKQQSLESPDDDFTLVPIN